MNFYDHAELSALRHKNESVPDSAIIEVFDIPPIAQLVIIKDTLVGILYLIEYSYNTQGQWIHNTTPMHSLETGAHLILHAVRYWQKEAKDV